MAKKIILHCGLPKTGSSALQVQLAQRRAELLEKTGFDYLPAGDFEAGRLGRIASGNGSFLARAYLPPNHPASKASERGRITEGILEKIRACPDNVILSSEFFSVVPPALMGTLTELLRAEGQVELIYFTRNQVTYLASSYMQQVKRHGEKRYPDEFFANWDHYKASMMYHQVFTQVVAACPGVVLHVRPYEASKAQEDGLMGLFLSLLGLPEPVRLSGEDRPVNLSPTPLELRLMLEVNRYAPRMAFSDMLVEASAQAGRSQIHSQHVILPPAFKREIKDAFDSDNTAFFRQFLNTDNQYAIDPDGAYVDLRSVSFEANDVMFIMAGLLSSLDKRIDRLEQGA